MKKYLAIVFVLVFVLSLSGCGTVNQGERNTITVRECPLLVECNDTLVMPYVNFSWSESYHEGEWYSADGRGISYKFPEIQNEIPEIVYREDFEIHCRKGVSFSSLAIYNSNFEMIHYGKEQTISSELTAGEYYLVISVKIQGDYIRTENEFERSGYDCAYKIIIPDDGLSVNYQGPFSCISHVVGDDTVASIDMTETAQKKILDVLNNGEWVNQVTNCGHDYEFTTENETIRYHSECGTFIDITHGRSMNLSETDRIDVNNMMLKF